MLTKFEFGIPRVTVSDKNNLGLSLAYFKFYFSITITQTEIICLLIRNFNVVH